MGLSRTAKISILLGITTSFFIVELTVGYVVGSLALIADAYHMLNDAISLGIALYAIKLSKRTANSQYSYGWHRAEVLAALVNGVFLLALCFSILLESLERFAHVPEVKDPKLIVIVGSVGLGCNIFGLLLFHEHGHSHGHDHGHSHGHGHSHSHAPKFISDTKQEQPSPTAEPNNDNITRRRSSSIQSMYGHPAHNRVALQQAAQDYYGTKVQDTNDGLELAERGGQPKLVQETTAEKTEPTQQHPPTSNGNHNHHNHPQDGALNVRAVVLHVAGDAAASVGVVISGLIMWFAKSRARFYADPTLSLTITILIACSAIPLVRSAGKILLQGVPSSISLSDVRNEISKVAGVESVHELHIWQLSESRLVASVHIKVYSTRPYMDIVRDVKAALHSSGIHSGTVQPEFWSSEDTKDCLIMCPPNTCSGKQACCPLPVIKEA